MNITLNQIKKHDPCSDGWAKLLKSLDKTKADDKPLSLMYILESNGIKDAVWALQCLVYRDYCLFNADVAESVLYTFEEKHPKDKRPREAIDAARKFHKGEITEEDLKVAADAARAAAYYAYDATAARAAAATAARAAAYDADAADAAHAADAYAAATSWEEIEQIFIKHFEEKE